jgi:hypothetical protein
LARCFGHGGTFEGHKGKKWAKIEHPAKDVSVFKGHKVGKWAKIGHPRQGVSFSEGHKNLEWGAPTEPESRAPTKRPSSARLNFDSSTEFLVKRPLE